MGVFVAMKRPSPRSAKAGFCKQKRVALTGGGLGFAFGGDGGKAAGIGDVVFGASGRATSATVAARRGRGAASNAMVDAPQPSAARPRPKRLCFVAQQQRLGGGLPAFGLAVDSRLCAAPVLTEAKPAFSARRGYG